MKREEIIEKLIEILKLTIKQPDDIIGNITESADLYTDLGLSSISMLYMIIAVEKSFGISFGDVKAGDFTTVKDVVDYIEKQHS